MLQKAPQAKQCQDDVGHPMQQHDKQQQQQGEMKTPLYSETNGRKKHSATKKSEHRYQIMAPPQDRRDFELDENGVPLGQRKCSICNLVAGHNKLTFTTLLERKDAMEVKQLKAQEHSKGPEPEKSAEKWRHPYTNKPYDSLADVASKVIHLFYKNMKQKINHNEDHKLWGITAVLDYLIEYATRDAYATYKAWATIDIVKKALCRLNYEK
ncbi:hypothetical protein ZWY2020_027994 [Hordeum vulgare]|nr:hypothetical protein ZWY2020_027994 [Hordeum vulgare]